VVAAVEDVDDVISDGRQTESSPHWNPITAETLDGTREPPWQFSRRRRGYE